MVEKKNKRIWKVILGVFMVMLGISGFSTSSKGMAIIFLLGGLALIGWYIYTIVLQKKEEMENKKKRAYIEEQEWKRVRLENEIKEQELIARKTEVETHIEKAKINKDRVINPIRKCPICGATTKGRFCEYCGTPIPDETSS